MIVRHFSSTVLVFHDFDDVVVFSRAGYGLQKLFRAYCGYNECTLEHFQSIVMPLGRFGGLWRGYNYLCDSETT